MTWPTTATKVNLDASGDDPKLARAELVSLIDKFNQLQAHVTAAAQGLLDDANAAAMLATIGAQASLITTRGDIVVGNSSNVAARLARGAANSIVSADATDTAFRTLTALIDAAIGSTRGQILYRNATVWTPLAPGTAGQMLQTGGAGADPSWVAAASGALVVIERKTGSAVAAYDFATGINSTYRTYKLIGWMLPATDQVIPWIRGSDDGGSTYEADANDYGWANHGVGSAVISNFDVFDTQMSMLIGSTSDQVGNASTEGIGFEITFHAPSSAAMAKKFHWSFSYIDAQATPEIRFGVGGGSMYAAAAMNAVRLMFSSGNIASGDVTLYGVANA